MKILLLMILPVFLLPACDSSDKATSKTNSTLYQKEIETLDQAKQMQKKLNEQAQQTQQRMDELNQQ